MLLFSNDIYMKQVGSARIYYPNHRFHHLDFNYFDFGKKRFYFDLIENNYGKSLLIQQKIKDNNDKWIMKGSVFIPLDATGDFVRSLSSILKSKRLKEEIEKQRKHF